MSVTVGFAFTGSFCTFANAIAELEKLAALYNVIPIMSEISYSTDTRFGKAADFNAAIEKAAGRGILHTIEQAEPIGPKKMLDALVIAPCTGNTLAKLAGGINDTPVTMAAKAHLRNSRPLVLAVSTNDGLGASARNIGLLLNVRDVYFVPMRQDDYVKKPRSVIADFTRIPDALHAALEGRQLQPVYLEAHESAPLA